MDTDFECELCNEAKDSCDRAATGPDSCPHKYCTECLSNHYSDLIYEGQYQLFKCPDIQCEFYIDDAHLEVLVGEYFWEMIKEARVENMNEALAFHLLAEDVHKEAGDNPDVEMGQIEESHVITIEKWNSTSLRNTIYRQGVKPANEVSIRVVTNQEPERLAWNLQKKRELLSKIKHDRKLKTEK
mmetsp:Transcript_22978/g.35472  ORF Transcript_22978/g.35472 Transcript_22978/m.35472 type:complete len:185 (-) Transcript_22978:1793-2347(-)